MLRQYRGQTLLFARGSAAGVYLESFLVAAVAAILGIRLYLQMTNYPRVGGGGLHIAHMLWGGLMMVIALILLLAFLGPRIQHSAAILGGLGFGTFINELGKFITSDNNYFYQPTVAIIYVIFVLFFLVFRAIGRQRTLTAGENLINALDTLKDAILMGMTTARRDQALRLLQQSDPSHPVARALEDVLQQIEWVPAGGPSHLSRAKLTVQTAYRRLVGQQWFDKVVLVIFVLHAVYFAVDVRVIGYADAFASFVRGAGFGPLNPPFSPADLGDLFGSTLSLIFILIGLSQIHRSRLATYHWFRRAILLSIFLIQFFSFYTQQFGALVGLSLDIILLICLNSLIRDAETVAGQIAEPIPPAEAPAVA